MARKTREEVREILRKVKHGELTEEEGEKHLCDDEDDGKAETEDAGPPVGGGGTGGGPGGGN